MATDQPNAEEDRWNTALLREVRDQLRDFTSPIELVRAGVTSDLPWFRIVYRTRGSNSELIGRILALPAEGPPKTESDLAAHLSESARLLVTTVKEPLT